MIFKIAMLQKQASLDITKNTAAVLAALEEAKALKCDLLLLPEAFLTSYKLPIVQNEALSETSVHIENVRRKAKDLGVACLLTSFMKGRERPKNSALLIDKKGGIILRYDKVHTCDFSLESCLESGSAFKTAEIDGVNLGVMICYDREYPESARTLMLKGAEIILVPNDCSSMEIRLDALKIRAYENMVGIAMANPPGTFKGNSAAFDGIAWDGEGICRDMCLVKAGEKCEGLFTASFDMDELRKYREREMMGNTFRKVHAYEGLLDSRVSPPFIRKKLSF